RAGDSRAPGDHDLAVVLTGRNSFSRDREQPPLDLVGRGGRGAAGRLDRREDAACAFLQPVEQPHRITPPPASRAPPAPPSARPPSSTGPARLRAPRPRSPRRR